MKLPNIYSQETVVELENRISLLSGNSVSLWGKMDVAQMLAHCNVAYEMAFENNHKAPNAVKRFLLKLFLKQIIVGDKPYSKNSPTSPQFKIADQKEFEKEKNRLINYIKTCANKGESYFEGKESLSFGKLTAKEWNNLFYKHLDHHLKQFGV